MRKLFVFISMTLALCCNAQNSNNDTNADGKVSIIDVCNTINKAIEKKNTGEVDALLAKLGNTVDEILAVEARTPIFEEITINGKTYHLGISGAIDLGLSIKWAAYNVGATSPAEYGDYFAWGETEPYYTEGKSQVSPCSSWKSNKTGYNWESYFDLDNNNEFSKYTVGIKTELDPEDDAAHVKWRGDWRMPTGDEVEELHTLASLWVVYSGQDGLLIVGKNNNAIFLPAAGLRYNKSLYFTVDSGHFWSSSLDASSNTAIAYDYGDTMAGWSDGIRFYGQSVRPVYGPASHDGGEEAN